MLWGPANIYHLDYGCAESGKMHDVSSAGIFMNARFRRKWGAFGAGTSANASQKGQDLLVGICVSIDKLCEKCRSYKRI